MRAEPVKDIEITGAISVNELIKRMGKGGGFTAKNLAVGVDILEEMLRDEGSLNFLSFPACVMATGVRGVVRDMAKRKWFDVVITTCGTLDHDLARCYGDYYHGDFFMDDVKLHKMGINRIGNVLVPNESYGKMVEVKMSEFLKEICSSGVKELATYELCWEIGKRLNENSLLYWCWMNGIPVVVPGLTDGAVGYQLWLFSQDHDLKINQMKDEKLLNDIIWQAKRSGALIVGGGISKHHVLWWNMFKGGLDYAVYITTATEYDGSLSGARPREAVSWGKVGEKAKTVTVDADATVVLPIMYAVLLERAV